MITRKIWGSCKKNTGACVNWKESYSNCPASLSIISARDLNYFSFTNCRFSGRRRSKIFLFFQILIVRTQWSHCFRIQVMKVSSPRRKCEFLGHFLMRLTYHGSLLESGLYIWLSFNSGALSWCLQLVLQGLDTTAHNDSVYDNPQRASRLFS